MGELPNRLSGSTEDDLDRTPVEMPANFRRPESLESMMARMIRQEVQRENDEEYETPEEADDFNEEDPDVLNMSPYTFDDLQDDAPASDMGSFWKEAESAEKPPEAPQEKIADDPDPDGQEATTEA